MRPTDLEVLPDTLHISWADGATSVLSATELRAAARDASSLRALHDTGKIDVPADLTITDVSYVGAYGVNIHFSDGHARAIYPFAYLRELAGLETS